jgi:hypothetical protein
MAEGDIRLVINDELATDPHHPLGVLGDRQEPKGARLVR